MLLIECDKCKQRFSVDGYTTPDTFEEPGEVVTDLVCVDELCDCLIAGEPFTVIEESYYED